MLTLLGKVHKLLWQRPFQRVCCSYILKNEAKHPILMKLQFTLNSDGSAVQLLIRSVGGIN